MPVARSPRPAWPPYCCVILRDSQGRYLLEQRPASARVAAGTLTCFGGSREGGEPPETCIRRELLEELGPAAAAAIGRIDHRVTVRSRRRLIAWFFAADAPPPEVPLVCEPGYAAVWLTSDELDAAPLSSWHRAAILAERRGEREAIVDD